MSGELVLYDNARSTNAIKVRLLLAELGLDARLVPMAMGVEQPPEYLALHPFGLIPTLVDGDVVVTESNTALRYLAEREERWDLRGADAVQRARVDSLLDSLSLEVRPDLWGVEEFAAYGLPVPDRERPGRIAALVAALDAFDQLLDADGPHAVGESLTIADCAIAGRFLHLDRLPLEAGTAPRLARVVAATRARPSFASASASASAAAPAGASAQPE
jgi:glutathione S-transferase